MKFELQAEARDVLGRSGNRQLRRLGKVPAVMYGGGAEPTSIQLDHNALLREMSHEAFYTSILTVKIDGQSQPVVVKDVQRHPARPLVMHLDFQRILEDEEITLHVPLHFVGEAVAKGVKEQGGVVEHLATDVEVSCLPRDLPAYIEVDVSHLELNEILHLSDLKLPEGVSLVALAHHRDDPVVTIAPPRREEVEPTAAEAAPGAEAAPAATTEPKAEG
ncbi:MAG TPA: 50S ribosomal protein L25/general stress protein Ctc [Gammaproteobacteria bacterium]|nr:50S ribosomal protein L25/general stress protein Ctc [Gammaproteobacteria bacterium]